MKLLLRKVTRSRADGVLTIGIMSIYRSPARRDFPFATTGLSRLRGLSGLGFIVQKIQQSTCGDGGCNGPAFNLF